MLSTVAARLPEVTTSATVYRDAALALITTMNTMAHTTPATTAVASPVHIAECIAPAPAASLATPVQALAWWSSWKNLCPQFRGRNCCGREPGLPLRVRRLSSREISSGTRGCCPFPWKLRLIVKTLVLAEAVDESEVGGEAVNVVSGYFAGLVV